MATTDKYDRQLRLWGAKGQEALGETTVLLLRATAAGTETLKNLVLPGVGYMRIVDDCLESQGDSNFFTPSSSSPSSIQPQTTKPRAQVAFEHLQELNPDVQGDWKHVDSLEFNKLEWDELTKNNATKILVIASDLEPPLLYKVADECHSRKLSLIVVDAYGLLGSVRLQTPPLALLEPKPETQPPDLRLVTPFAELQLLADTIDWESLDDAQHGHVPYPLILLRLNKEWKDSHNGTLPKTFAEKEEFRSTIRKASRKWDHQLNFQEAMQNAYVAYTERNVDWDHIQDLIQTSQESCPKLHSLLVALQELFPSAPPLHGSIPDMTASTDIYIRLQKLYQDQAAKDIARIRQWLLENYHGDNMPEEEDIVNFCKNVHDLDILTTRTLLQEYQEPPPLELVEDWNMTLFDPYEVPEQTPFLWYMALRACRTFYQSYGRYPGTIDNYVDDVGPLHQCMIEVAKQMQLDDFELVQQTLLNGDQRYAQEMVRYGQAEIHTVASVVGGVASQEAVKIITGQYIPFNNTYIYNGIVSAGGVYKF